MLKKLFGRENNKKTDYEIFLEQEKEREAQILRPPAPELARQPVPPAPASSPWECKDCFFEKRGVACPFIMFGVVDHGLVVPPNSMPTLARYLLAAVIEEDSDLVRTRLIEKAVQHHAKQDFLDLFEDYTLYSAKPYYRLRKLDVYIQERAMRYLAKQLETLMWRARNQAV